MLCVLSVQVIATFTTSDGQEAIEGAIELTVNDKSRQSCSTCSRDRFLWSASNLRAFVAAGDVLAALAIALLCLYAIPLGLWCELGFVWLASVLMLLCLARNMNRIRQRVKEAGGLKEMIARVTKKGPLRPARCKSVHRLTHVWSSTCQMA